MTPVLNMVSNARSFTWCTRFWLTACFKNQFYGSNWLTVQIFPPIRFLAIKSYELRNGDKAILGQNQTHNLREYEKSCPKQVSKPLFYFVQAKWAGHMESNVRRNTCKISMPRLVIIKYVRLAATSVSARKSGTRCAEWDNWKLTTTRYLLPWKIDSLLAVWANVHISKWRL